MNKQNFEKYAQLKEQEKEIAEEIKELKPLLVEDMLEAKADKVESDYGTFSIVKRKHWTYSSDTQALDLKLKEIKKTEEADGTATYTEKENLMFTNKKE